MCTLSSVLLSSTQTVTSNGPLTLLLKNLKSHCTATLFSQSKRAFFHRSLPLSFRLFITPALSHNSGLIAAAQWRSTMAGRFFAESVNLGVCVQPMRVSLCVWSQAGPGKKTMTHYRWGNYYRAIFSLHIDALSFPPHSFYSFGQILVKARSVLQALQCGCRDVNQSQKAALHRVRFNLEHVKWGVKQTR